jgi:hypothetical protein
MQPATDAAERLRAIAAQLPAYNPDTTPPKPESGYINSPEGAQLAATPEELAAIQGIVAPQPTTDDLESMTKAELLECGLAIGAFAAGSKLRETGLRKAIRAKRAERAATVDGWVAHGFVSAEDKPVFVGKSESTENPTLRESIVEIVQGLVNVGAISAEEQADILSHFTPAPGGVFDEISQELTEQGVKIAVAAGSFEDFGIVGIDRSSLKEEAPMDTGFTLYVDCAPLDSGRLWTGGSVEHEANKLVHAEFPQMKFADWRLVQYGQGAALLCHYAAQIVRDRQLSAVVLDTRTPAGSVLVNALSLIATNIVRGLR